MGFVVEAWFHNSEVETILELLGFALTASGFSKATTLTSQTVS